MHRTSREIGVQAIVFGALGFRASLEVTEHPRSKDLCSQLVPWLEQLDLDAPIEELHREILKTPHSQLSRQSQIEAYWRGEAASFLGWTIQVFDRPDPVRPIDPASLVNKLRLLQPDVSQFLSRVHLRPQLEIEDYCALCLAVRHRNQVSVLQEDAQTVLKRIHESKLAELGLSEAYRRINLAEVDAILNHPATTTKGLYVVRSMTAEWLLGANG